MQRTTCATIFSIMVSLFVLPANALAYCSAPTPPDPPSSYQRPTKPSAPYCVNTYSNTHTCDQWEIDSYNNALRTYKYEVDDYIRKLKNYVSEASQFASETVDYANCEIRNLD
ncbi:MAG: hypothetical protein HN472_07155 [Nitrospina sp.]|nr:hypothetical protein [Nitrospina sp.]